jgi:predicted enzyme related to lactoylglutathione lyase
MTSRRQGPAWTVPAAEYGRALPALTINLLVHDVARSVAFYREVLEAETRHHDEDFAALRLGAHDLMLHADHAYDRHPWADELERGGRRGLGAELRLLGPDADQVERRARGFGAPVLGAAADKPHGWRETWIADPDGYVWAVGHRIGS